MGKKIKELWNAAGGGALALLAVVLVLAIALGLVFGVMAFEAWILMLLWNAVITALWAGAPSLTFWLAFGLILICNILFKSSKSISSGKN